MVTSTGGPSADSGLSAARRALVDFAERSPATQADIDHVMRALVSHDGWYVPARFADRGWGQTKFDQMLPFPEAAPNPMLNVFTDRESAMLADGRPIGLFGGPVRGMTLMRALDADLDALVINPASPVEHQWYIAAGGFDIAATWATGIAVEQALAQRGSGPVPTAQLLTHRYTLLMEKPNRSLAQIYLPDIDGAVSVCFTASDRVDEFVGSLPPAARPLVDVSTVDGQRMFEMMREVGAAGLVVNAGSDDQTALTGDDIADIIAAAPVRR